MVTVKCKWCKAEFKAKPADIKRGWAKFCSKSCKAKEQTKRTGVSGPTEKNEQNYDYGSHLLRCLERKDVDIIIVEHNLDDDGFYKGDF